MMAFYNSDFGDRGEYDYYSSSYDVVPFRKSSSSSNYSNGCYDIVPFQESSSSNYETNGYGIVPYQDSSSSNYETNGYGIVPYQVSSSSNYETHGNDIVPFQDPYFYSSLEYPEPNFFEYEPNAYNEAYDPFITPLEVNYSAHNFIEPKLLEYNPIFHNSRYFSSDTRFVISYSNAPVLDDTEFDDYDSTPYDGGYDIAQTYGKPLQPSDEICYPRSVPSLDIVSSVDTSHGSVPSPHGKTENETKQVPKSEPILEKEQPIIVKEPEKTENEIKQVPKSEPILEKEQPNIVKEPEKPSEPTEGDESEGSDSDNGETRGDNGSYDKQKVQFQGTYGYGLEAMDLCDGLFGYWPCLDKKIRRECSDNCERVTSEENPWKSAADYLFSSPYTYDGDGFGNYRYHNYD